MAPIDDDKVMDVSRPGKGRIMPTSRPVIAPLSQTSADDKDVVRADKTEEPEKLIEAPSHRVIEPLIHEDITDANESSQPDGPAAQDEPVLNETEAAAPEQPAIGPTGSENAEVQALADSVETKKRAVKEAEEQAKKDAEVDALIDSKKYFVQIGHDAGRHRTGYIIILILCVALACVGAAVYFMVLS